MSSISGISSSMSYGMYGTDQQKRKQDLFNKVDSDGNGGISQTELQSLTDKISQDSGTTLDASTLLSQYDSNSDGSLSSDEMNSLMESIKPQHERDAMTSGNDQSSGSQSSGLDTTSLAAYMSNSGQDLVSSLISMLQQLQSSSASGDSSSSSDSSTVSGTSSINGMQGPPPPPPNGQDMFKKVDSDGSGSVSSDELQTMLDKMPEKTGQTQDAATVLSQYDSNSDGSLSSDELGSMMKAMGPPPPPPQQAQNSSTDSSSTSSSLQDALASLLQNTDQNSLSSLLKMLKNSSDSGLSTQSLNVIS